MTSDAVERDSITFDSSGILGESSESRSSFVFDRVRTRVEEFEYTFDVSSLFREANGSQFGFVETSQE